MRSSDHVGRLDPGGQWSISHQESMFHHNSNHDEFEQLPRSLRLTHLVVPEFLFFCSARPWCTFARLSSPPNLQFNIRNTNCFSTRLRDSWILPGPPCTHSTASAGQPPRHARHDPPVPGAWLSFWTTRTPRCTSAFVHEWSLFACRRLLFGLRLHSSLSWEGSHGMSHGRSSPKHSSRRHTKAWMDFADESVRMLSPHPLCDGSHCSAAAAL